ncbi:MAG: methyltransferase domain-containing protein [Janthinobacterium lividum]
MLTTIPEHKIQKSFDRASVTYDEVAVVQKECARLLGEMIQQQDQNFNPHVILDLGGGTGFMTKALLPKYSESHYYLNDVSSQMLLKAQKNLQDHAQIDYLLGDMTSLSYDNYNPDLSVANLSFQWVNQFDHFIKEVFAQSQVLAFTYLLPDTFQEWGQMFKKLNLPEPTFKYWPEEKWYGFLKSLDSRRLIIKNKKFTLTFANARDFMVYLRELGANQSEQSISLKDIRKVLTTYDQPFSITYHVLFVILARKLT